MSLSLTRLSWAFGLFFLGDPAGYLGPAFLALGYGWDPPAGSY